MDAFFIVFGTLAVFIGIMALYIHFQEKKEKAKTRR
jgi:hypothetical protein